MKSDAKLVRDLERSGIPIKLIGKLGFEVLTPEKVSEFLGKDSAATAYSIPYFSITGERINFTRLRLLSGRWKKGFAGSGATFKYNQKAKSAPHLYIPPVYPWKKHLKNGKLRLPYLCVTEGEKKAIKACLCDIPTVALGGVFNFQSKKRGISLLPEFDAFDLTDGVLEIAFDNDSESNEDVRKALNAFASAASALRPKEINFVIFNDGEKMGLDDFLVQYETDDEAREAFYALPRRKDTRRQGVSDFDERLVFVHKLGKFYDTKLSALIKGRSQLYDAFERMPKVPSEDDPRKMVAPIKLWVEQRSPSTDVYSLTYAPGAESRIASGMPDAPENYNTWKPTALIPKKGSVKPWLDLFDFLTQELSEEHKKWLMQWFAYPIQHVGEKMFTAVFIYSHMHGIGKNFLVDPFMEFIYGKANYSRVDNESVQSQFNKWASNKQFIFIDEADMATRRDRRHMRTVLNSLITNKTVDIELKGVDRDATPNHSNIYINSNIEDALSIDRNDRRLFVIHGPEYKAPQSLYGTLDDWWRNKNGSAYLYNHFLNVDLTGFDPRAAAPRTKARTIVVEASADNIDGILIDLFKNPTEILSVNGVMTDKQLYTATELLTSLNAYIRRVTGGQLNILPNQFSRRIKNSNFPFRRILADKALKTRLYAVVNRTEWAERTAAQWKEHWTRTTGRE